MFSRSGLRFRMAVSYVALSTVVVVAVEAVLLAIFVPRLRSADQKVKFVVGQSATDAVMQRAETEGAKLSAAAERLAGRSRLGDQKLLVMVARQRFASSRADVAGETELVATPRGEVVGGSTSPRPGSTLPVSIAGATSRSGTTKDPHRPVDWAIAPITAYRAGGSQHVGAQVIGVVYLQRPLSGTVVKSGRDPVAAIDTTFGGAGGVLLPGLIILGLLVPMGALFGLLSTGRLIQRVRRLVAGITSMADGDLSARIPVSGGDEVGRLEDGFNRMAERLTAAVRAERAAARQAERTRIARELHDSVSQDLFSVNLLAGGLREAITDGELRSQAESLERTVGRTMREMRAMLLELRPIDLEDAGLALALDQLCRAYEARLGVRITTDVGLVQLRPEAEHAVLRLVQEALGNATRHGDAETIELSLTGDGGRVEVVVRDDGRGFDPARAGERHGMGLGLMRDRVTELGGTFQVVSAPGQGTVVRARIPEVAA
ncbi:HAMP domain-containing sensor histidine kinase [Actinoallomurus oryzae]